MEWVGQAATHAPQPVQASGSRSIRPTGRARKSNPKARLSQKSVQERHSTPAVRRQEVEMAATLAQGTSVVSRNTSSGQASAQAPQKVHSPLAKLTTGVRAGPGIKIASGQARKQSPQEEQDLRTASSSVQGGRK